jgi:hypothetical protein
MFKGPLMVQRSSLDEAGLKKYRDNKMGFIFKTIRRGDFSYYIAI